MKTILEAIKDHYGKYPLVKNRMFVRKSCGLCEERITKGQLYYDGQTEWAHEECVNLKEI